MRSALFLLALAACGRSPAAGPSPVSPAPAVAASSAPAAAALPAGLDPGYVRTITTIRADGTPYRWTAGPFRHCFDSSVAAYRAQLEAIADRMSALSGIPRTEAGPCNVEWLEAPVPVGAAQTMVAGTEQGIVGAVVRFRFARFIVEDGIGAHESGHVLGLEHSTRPGDLMRPAAGAADFSADELAVLAWMYGR